MRCRGAIRQLGPFIDGELGEVEANAVRKHLDACAECSRRYHYMRGLVRQLSSLPAIVPTPEESYSLWNRLRREMTAPADPKPAARRTQLAAAALSVLVLITVAGLGIAIWNGGGPAPITEETAVEAARTGETEGELGQESSTSGTNAGTGLLAAAVARPDVVISQNEYDATDLEEFRNDLGTRLDFYSTYWYPSSGGTTRPAALAELRTELTSDLTEQAAAAGQNPEELQLAVTVVMEQADDDSILPCYAERAKIEGKDAWLISASGPEDYLLFPDQQRPPAMILASLGGEESLKVSESALKELASILAPSGSNNAPLVPAGTLQEEGDADVNDKAADEPAGGAEGEETQTWEGTAQEKKDFQSFLRRLAAQGTSLDTISALQELNYEQVLQLLQGDWSALAAGGADLSDFLTPPQRLWAVDCASGEIIWSAE